MKNKLSFLEAISIIAIITISQIILDFPKYLIYITGTGTIINLCLLALLVFIFCILLSHIFKFFANQDIIDIAEFIGGKFLKYVISFVLILFLFFTAILSASHFVYLLKNTYFKNTPLLFIFSIFWISILIACWKGFSSTKKVSTFFFGILAISILCLLLGDNGNYNANNLLPLFGFNYQTTFQTGLVNVFIFNYVFIYFFLMPIIQKKNHFKKIIYTSFFLNFMLIMVSVIAILQYFPTPITEDITNVSSTNMILTITRRIQISSFLSQTDSIFVLFWGYAILCYISILIDAIIYIFNKTFHYENQEILSFSLVPIFIGGVILINHLTMLYYLENTVFKFFSIFLIFGISFTIILLGYFKRKGVLHGKMEK